ncbi:eCIS core domain-containing protein [Actinacidiphila sp. ITFR-21]|uniref:eCIS core domain-containing protein n=1 Tax=Actinacidiphila sp. ITFR-21 TaxID=3075199 RepID=UPI0028899B44|nr:DUF4157 domain-containing protein [Streptomyces sp. ITFR-21]WNI18144.1 DUF4157 domain-containing protein [Streptomyces sp. ITFR-21]
MHSRPDRGFVSRRTDAARRCAAELGARAHTSGDRVVVGPGGRGRRALARGLTHVIQRRGGPVPGTPTGGGVGVSGPAGVFERASAMHIHRHLVCSRRGNVSGSVSRP